MLKKILRILKTQLKYFFKENYRQSSFSQCGEDLIVSFIFKTLRINNPTYIDIGAHHPFKFNNTALFYEKGSRGINIEPNFLFFKQIKKNRKRDINLNIGIDSESGTRLYYHINHSTLNTFSSDVAHGYASEGNFKIEKSESIQVKSLNQVLEKYFNNKCPDFMSIDVEGYELEVLKSLDFEKHYPKVICAETISFSTRGQGVKNIPLIDFIKSKGYSKYADTAINTIFVHIEAYRKSKV